MKYLSNKAGALFAVLACVMIMWSSEARSNWDGYGGYGGYSNGDFFMAPSYPVGGGYGYGNGGDYGYGNGGDYGYGNGYGNGGYDGGYPYGVPYGEAYGYGGGVPYNGYGWNGGCCNPCCCRPCGHPLRPCHFSLTAKGGVSFGVFADRQKNEINNFVAIAEASCSCTTTTPLALTETLLVQTDRVRTPEFDDIFDTPWTVGAELGYAVSCNTEVFLDGNYLKAQGRNDRFTVVFPQLTGIANPTVVVKPEETVRVREKFSDLESYDGYIGFRYYFPRCCCATFFFGTKIGFRHWQEVKARTCVTTTFPFGDGTSTVVSDLGRRKVYPDQTVVSGGFQVGINYCIGNCLSLVVTAEALASGQFKFGNNRRRPVQTFSTTIIPGISRAITETLVDIPSRRMGTIFMFPITIGLRYNF